MATWLLFLLFSVTVGDTYADIVRTEQGTLNGTFYELPNGKKVHAFYSIPFAAPPVREYRFLEPQKPKGWKGIWNASILSSRCLQYTHSYSIFGEEDCLYLNVYTPKLPRKHNVELMDVMFYIHGGGFMAGASSDILPDYILKNNDIVFVSTNYRLNIFGFFSSGDNIVPGNNGLKDQVAALKWVQRNIKNFGGNPSSITIAGCSAGGASVHYHFLSPLSEGLFHRGISLSGTTLPPWTLPKNNTEKSIHLASILGCPTDCTKSMVNCLRERPAKQIIESTKNFLTWRYCPFTSFGPVVEPPNDGAFLNEKPIALLTKGKIKDLPWLTSLCKEEGLYPAADFIDNVTLLHELNENWNEIAPNLLMYNYSVSANSEKERISAAIRKYYFGDKQISNETIKEIIQMLGDRAFYNDIVSAIKLHSAAVHQNVFCYKFNYRGKHSLSTTIFKNTVDYGTSHSDDLSYVLKFLPANTEETESDAAMVNEMTKMFGNFIKTGDPTDNRTVWEPTSKNQNHVLRCLNIHSSIKLEMNDWDTTSSINFWRSLLPSEYPLEFPSSTRSDEL